MGETNIGWMREKQFYWIYIIYNKLCFADKNTARGRGVDERGGGLCGGAYNRADARQNYSA